MQVDLWTDVKPSDPNEFQTFFSDKILRRRYIKTSTKTPNPIAPTCISDVNLLIYKDDSSLAWESISYAPNQYLSDSFKFKDNWEVLTADAQSKQVVLRMSYTFEWVKKPMLIAGLIENAIVDQIAKTNKVA